MAERVAQPAPVVRLRLHPKVGLVAQPQVQLDRGARQLLRDENRISSGPLGRRPEQVDQAGPASHAARNSRGEPIETWNIFGSKDMLLR